MNRILAYDHQTVILAQCSRATFGVVCEREYNRQKHQGQAVSRNEFDGKLYVGDQVDWIVRMVCGWGKLPLQLY